MKKEEFKKKASTYHKKWQDERYAYHKAASDIAKTLNIKTSLEAGTRKVTICENSDTIDIESKVNPTYLHDLSILPYPVTKKYDLFVALRVFHHVKADLKECFKELERIADNIIIAVPPKGSNHLKTYRKGVCWSEFTDRPPHIIEHTKTKTYETIICYWNVR